MISREEIVKLSQLARLELPEGEIEGLQKDISNILEYVGKVREFGAVPGTPPEAPLLRNVLREDVLREEGAPLSGTEERLREALPRRHGDYAVVRTIIQKDE